MLQSSSALKQQLRRRLGLKAWGTCSSRRLLLRPKRRRRLRLASLASAISNSFPTVEMSESIFCAFHSGRFLYFCTHTEANNHWSHSHCLIPKQSFGSSVLKRAPFAFKQEKSSRNLSGEFSLVEELVAFERCKAKLFSLLLYCFSYAPIGNFFQQYSSFAANTTTEQQSANVYHDCSMKAKKIVLTVILSIDCI